MFLFCLKHKNKTAKKVSLKEAVKKEPVSIDDWRKHAQEVKQIGDTEILQYESYETEINDNECIIRPIS